MPRKYYRKDRPHHNVSGDDFLTPPPSGWKHNQGYNKSNALKADADKSFPRLGQHIVSSPTARQFSQQKQTRESHSSIPFSQRRHFSQLVCADNNYHQEDLETGISQQQVSKAIILSSGEFKQCVLQAIDEGKRRMDEWIFSELEQAFSPDGHVISHGCSMDWQPEMTIVIPQNVEIHYPWDIPEDAKERWERKKVDGMG
jgi:hypothetical protein